MNINEICEEVVSTGIILFYFDEYPDQRKDLANGLKQSFCSLIDSLLNEVEEQRAGLLNERLSKPFSTMDRAAAEKK